VKYFYHKDILLHYKHNYLKQYNKFLELINKIVSVFTTHLCSIKQIDIYKLKTDIMDIKKVMVAGGGILGSQIAWQVAFSGFEVSIYDAFEKGLENVKASHQKFADLFLSERGATEQQITDTFKRLSYTTDMAEAVKDADILSESIPEVIEIKMKFYTELGKIAPNKTIFTINSSTTIPSMYAEATGRPDMFVGLHFATGGIWDTNIGEVMGHAGTDKNIYNTVIDFARAIGMVAIPVKKENPGFVMNAITIPFVIAGIDLVMNGVADPEYVDKTWMISTKSTLGPCIFMDIAGMNTVYNGINAVAEVTKDETMIKRAEFIKVNYLDKGKLGMSSGEGFYTYPNPAYEQAAFLKK